MNFLKRVWRWICINFQIMTMFYQPSNYSESGWEQPGHEDVLKSLNLELESLVVISNKPL